MNETREGKVKSKEEKGLQNEKRTADELLEELADYLQNKEKVEKHIEAYLLLSEEKRKTYLGIAAITNKSLIYWDTNKVCVKRVPLKNIISVIDKNGLFKINLSIGLKDGSEIKLFLNRRQGIDFTDYLKIKIMKKMYNNFIITIKKRFEIKL